MHFLQISFFVTIYITYVICGKTLIKGLSENYIISFRFAFQFANESFNRKIIQSVMIY